MRMPLVGVTIARIHGPAHVWAVRHWHLGPCSTRTFTPAPPPNRQAFLLIEAIHFLLFHRKPLPLRQDADASIPKPATLARNLMHLLATIRMIGKALAPHGLGIDTNHVADPALRDFVLSQRPDRRFPPLSRYHQRFS